MLAWLFILFNNDVWLHTIILDACISYVARILVATSGSFLITFVILGHLDLVLWILWLRKLKVGILIIFGNLFWLFYVIKRALINIILRYLVI